MPEVYRLAGVSHSAPARLLGRRQAACLHQLDFAVSEEQAQTPSMIAKNIRSINHEGVIRVIRGGSWYYVVPDSLAASARGRYDPAARYFSLGFRCIRRMKE
jgi:formylglycine-generating enzyme required for sulfatase activity